MNVKEYLKKISDLPQRLDSVLRIVETFDTTLRVDTTTNVTKLCTHEINYYVNEADFSFEDTLKVSCFTYERGIPLYSDPPTFDVAKLNPNGFGYIPDKDWQEWFKHNNINPDIIKKVKDVLASKPPVNY